MDTKPVIIEASQIYFGGGYTLLKLLIDEFEGQQMNAIVYLCYDEVLESFQNLHYNFITFIKTTQSATIFRFFQKRSRLLFMCNLPPFTKQINSILYFHNSHIIDFSFERGKQHQNGLRFKYFLYRYIIRKFSRNVDVVGCQTESIRNKLEKIGVKTSLLPFFDETKPVTEKKNYDFCFISAVTPHKNHRNLLKACKLLSKTCRFSLALTVNTSERNHQILGAIEEINKVAGDNIVINLGRLNREEVIQLYSRSRALIFPSYTETFGLPVIEAAQCGLTVIASDRPFIYDILENPVVFDPSDPTSIADQMQNFLNGKFEFLEQRLKPENKLNEIINYFKDSQPI